MLKINNKIARQNIEVVFLDFYGTLVHEDGIPINEICSRISDSSHGVPNPREIAAYWWNTFYTSFNNSFGSGFHTQRSIEEIALSETLKKFRSPLAANEICEEMFLLWEKPPLFRDTVEFLDCIIRPVCIVSNIDRADILSAMNFNNLDIKNVVTSEDAHSYKPRPEIFNIALELMNTDPQCVMHIGDSISSDVLGARSLGIRTCWLNRRNKTDTRAVWADIQCNDLLELAEYLNDG